MNHLILILKLHFSISIVVKLIDLKSLSDLRFYGNLIGVKYGEPYVVKEMLRIDDVVSMPVRSI